MPTLSIDKNASPGQEAQGRQRRLSLPRLRVPVQPAPFGHRAVLGSPAPARVVADSGVFVLRHKSLDALPAAADSMPSSLSSAQTDASAVQQSPVAFAREVLGVDLWDKQVEVLTALTEHRRVAVKAGNGLGKGFCAAVAVLWYIHSHPDEAIVLTTAPTFRQVRHILWRQIHRLYRPAAGTLGGQMLDTRWDISDQCYAMGLSADGADQFQGFHNPNMFIVVDEAEGVSEQIYEAVEAVMTSASPLLLLIGNPTTMDGAFRRAFYQEGHIYRNITISALDSPNVQAGRVVVPGLTTADWVEERRLIWGETDSIYRSRVLGKFPDQGENTLLRLSDIEAATVRPVTAPQGGGPGEVVLAVDVARYGSDSTVILRRRGGRVEDIQELRQQDTMAVAARVAAAILEHSPSHVSIDEIGVGAGVVDRLREMGHKINGVNVARSARKDREYSNLRAEGYGILKELFGAGLISIPADARLVSELASLRYEHDRQGRIKMESKDEMRSRHRKSPDRADALMLAFLPPGGRMQVWL